MIGWTGWSQRPRANASFPTAEYTESPARAYGLLPASRRKLDLGEQLGQMLLEQFVDLSS
jgi:hypothetical protein